MKLGYACINTVLGEHKITTNRGMIKRTFKAKGLPYASELSLKNCKDLLKILRWNVDRDIRFFRLSSDLFPWSSEYDLTDLPDYEKIGQVLEEAGSYAKQNDIRITTHPGPFNVLGSPKEDVVFRTLKDLSTHGQIFDLMGLENSPYAKINIHVGGTYGCHERTSWRWIKGFSKLPDSVRSRLTLENDDRSSQWSVRHLHELVSKETGVPIVFDYHHHRFCDGGLSEREALELALSTWGSVTPVVHYSQSKAEEQGDDHIRPQAHSDSYWECFDLYGNDADVMLECKHKEQGLFKMRELLSL